MADEPNEYVARLALEFLTLWLEPGDEARQEASEHIAARIKNDEGRLTMDDAPIDVMLGLFWIEELLVRRLGEALELPAIDDPRIGLDGTGALDALLLTDAPYPEEAESTLFNDILGHLLNMCARLVLMLAALEDVEPEVVLQRIAPAVRRLDDPTA